MNNSLNTLALLLIGLLTTGCFPSTSPADAPEATAIQGEFFKAYQVDFSQTESLPTEVALPNAANGTTAAKVEKGTLVTLKEDGTWRGYWAVGFLPPNSGYATLNGGERLHVAYTYSTTSPNPASANAVLSIQYLGGETIQIGGADKIIADGEAHVIEYSLPSDASSKRICALWLQLENAGPGTASFLLEKFWWDRPRISNRLDADSILKTPPLHDARAQMVGGQMAITIDGAPVSGLGWAPMVSSNVGDAEIADMVGESSFRMARLVTPLGDSLLGYYPPNWLGPDQFDFSYLDQQMARIQKANPLTKVILYVALDGAKWWNWKNPQAVGMDMKNGIPDYLSPEWRRDSRDAIRQMVAHIQTSPYTGMIVGYQLFNGWTMDTVFEVNTETPSAVRRYRNFLKEKYKTDVALRAAWSNSTATIATAKATATTDDYKKAFHSPGAVQLLFEPARHYELVDKLAFRNHVWQQVILNFAKDIKEATHNRALTGARAGDLLGNSEWLWPQPTSGTASIDELLESPYFDMFEVQEPYVGRGIGDYGSGVPIPPPQAMAAHNKLVIIENDVRTHLSALTEGYGRTPDLATTLQMQRRIFANSLVHGMHEYFWQMAYRYNDPTMLADFRKMEQINLKSMHADRDTGAEIAFVFDTHYRKYFGYDPDKSAPSRGFTLFDYLKFTWARAGVPYDMISLDQLPKAKPYKVYVFVQTVGLSDTQRSMIKNVVRRDGRVGIFFWADGAIDGQRFNEAKMSDLSGMEIKLSTQSTTWKMSPTPWFQQQAKVCPQYLMGTLATPTTAGSGNTRIPLYDASEPNAGDNTFAPSFWVSDKSARALATYDAGHPLAGRTGIAAKKAENYTSIYSASPILSVALLRYALQQAGAFSYTDTPDNSYINRSFIGLNAQTSPAHVVQVRVPKPTGLYEVFRDQELPVSDQFSIPVEPGQTYLYFRGSKTQWEKLTPALP